MLESGRSDPLSARLSTEHLLVAIALAIGLAHGILRASVNPLWGSPEEPYHFLHAREFVDPSPEAKARDFDQVLESIVWVHDQAGAAGVMANGRLIHELDLLDAQDWRHLRDQLGSKQNYVLPTEPKNLGTPQTDEPPGYYWYQALFQFIAIRFNISVGQSLMLGRYASVLLGVVSILLAYGTAREVFPTAPLLRVVPPILLAVHPNFMNVMSAFNNTAAGVVALSLLLLASVQWIFRGASAKRLVFLGLAFAACVLSKPTAWIGVPLGVVALLLERPHGWLKWGWIGGIILSPVIILLAGSSQGARYWYPSQTTVIETPNAPVGARVLHVDREALNDPVWQHIPVEIVQASQGQTFTVGAWMRSPTGAAHAALPAIWTASEGQLLSPTDRSSIAVVISEEWQFHTFTMMLPYDAQCAVVVIMPGSVPIEYDGVVVTVEKVNTSIPPAFDSDRAISGTWGSRNFQNAILNGGWEDARFLLNHRFESIFPSKIADTEVSLNRRIAGLTDWHTSLAILWLSARWLFSSAWSIFMWTVPGLPTSVIWFLGGLSAVSIAGLAAICVRGTVQRGIWSQRGIFFLILCCVLAIASVLLRIDPPTLLCSPYYGRYIPTGYYLIPVLPPLITLWLVGLRQWVPSRYSRWLVVCCILMLSVITIGSMLHRHIPYALSLYGIPQPNTFWSVIP